MKSLSINKGLLHSRIELPSSKSYANRALVASALIKDARTLKNISQSSDVNFLIECLKKVGLELFRTQDEIIVLNSFPECEIGERELEVGEGGTTARFLATMLLLGKYQYKLILGDRLKHRPWDDFIELASKLGAKVSLEGPVLSVQGPVNLTSEIEVNCSKTSQFASAFELLRIVKDIMIIPRQLESSQSYWKMTQLLVKEIKHKEIFNVPLDWSSASYPLAFGALHQEIVLPHLELDPFQADSKFFDILNSFNCVEETSEAIRVSPLRDHHDVFQDVSDCLDLVPALIFFLSHVEGKHILSGVKNLIYKESNRLQEVIKLVQAFKRIIYTEDDSLIIHGSKSLMGQKINLTLPNDHRIVMAATLFLLHHSGGQVCPTEAVDKSFPGFFSLLRAS